MVYIRSCSVNPSKNLLVSSNALILSIIIKYPLNKLIKKCFYYCYVRCATKLETGGTPWPINRCFYYQAELGLLRKRSCNLRVSCQLNITRVLGYRILIQADDALDYLDDHLKIEGEFYPYEVRYSCIYKCMNLYIQEDKYNYIHVQDPHTQLHFHKGQVHNRLYWSHTLFQ